MSRTAPSALVRMVRTMSLRSQGLLDAIEEALAFERRSRQEIDARVTEKLRGLLEHAAANVPFHAERLRAAGLEPSRVGSIADLAALPPMTKADLRGEGERLLAGGRIGPA